MGLLDDAIREHLDLKRRRGADPTEIERAERDALGPVRRIGEEGEPASLQAAHPDVEEPGHDVAGSDHEVAPQLDWHEPDDDADHEPLEREHELFDEDHEPPVGAGDTELLPAIEPDLPPTSGAEPVAPVRAPHEDEDDEFDSSSAPRRPEPAGSQTVEYDVEHALESEREERHGRGDDERAEHDHEKNGEPGDDVLEETPEFLQDTPEHDRLWFEQKPPRDFDFDG